MYEFYLEQRSGGSSKGKHLCWDILLHIFDDSLVGTATSKAWDTGDAGPKSTGCPRVGEVKRVLVQGIVQPQERA